MISSPFIGDAWAGPGIELASRRSEQDVGLFGFGTPIGPIESTTYLDRPAWRFRFAAPPHKPFDMQVVVDAGTGLVLEQRYDDHSVTRWTEFTVGVPVLDASFVWDGPAASEAAQEVKREAEYEKELARRRAWFAAHVTDVALVVGGSPVEVTLHDWDDTGGFEASLDDARDGAVDGAVARRPRADTWWDLGWFDVTERWTDERWDWAVALHALWHDDVDPEHARAVRRWLDAAG